MGGDMLQNAPVVGMKKRFPRSFGRYVLEKSLSRGGMGEVILAVAKGVHRRCVIKTIRGDLVGDDEFIGRFADEAKIMVRISHDNIIRVFDAGKVADEYYIAMEYVHGRDLGDVLDRAYERGEPMPTQLGLFVTSELLRGLGYAHALTDERGRHMGLVHRDISPQNVLIGFDGSIKLIDFGLARTEVLPGRTQGALAVGKYGYMSPEQARHESIDGRADIYSAGVMLFEVFTGDRLVDEQDQSTLWQRVLSPKHRNPRSVIGSLPSEIDDLVMSAVAVRPNDRFQDAQQMLDFVERLRRPESNRDAFVRYLRYLYPKVDFNPPPMPTFDASFDVAAEKSMIIATSREGAQSVFGRGELPIEWTRQISSEEVQRQLRRRKPDVKAFDRDKVITDAHDAPQESPLGTASVDATVIRDTVPPEPTPSSLDQATVVAEMPADPRKAGGYETTRYSRPPDDPSGPEDTLQSAPVRNLGPKATYRDDEMTVMMDAPPVQAPSLSAPMTPSVAPSGSMDDGDAPTRLSRVPEDDAPAAPSVSQTKPVTPAMAAATRGRAIRELNRSEPARDDRDARRDADLERAKRKQFAVHRQTVPTEPSPRSERRPDPAESFDARSTADRTMPVRETNDSLKWIVPGVILFGLALVVMLVVLLLR